MCSYVIQENVVRSVSRFCSLFYFVMVMGSRSYIYRIQVKIGKEKRFDNNNFVSFLLDNVLVAAFCYSLTLIMAGAQQDISRSKSGAARLGKYLNLIEDLS